jgi:hypothetical protein
METPRIDELGETLDGMERANATLGRQVRLLAWAGGLTWAIGLVLVFGGAGPENPAKVVESRSFRLFDADGAPRGLFFGDAAWPSLALGDLNRKTRLAMGLSPDGTPDLRLSNDQSKDLLSMGVFNDSPSVDFRDRERKARAHLVILGNGASSLSFVDSAKNFRSTLDVDAAGNPELRLQDSAGANRIYLSLPQSNRPTFFLANSKRKLGFNLFIASGGQGGRALASAK